MYTCGSLFSGQDGIGLAMYEAGIIPRWHVEIDEWCRDLLALRFPRSKIFKDVHHVGGHNLETVDVLVGGFPCQPVSQAGARRGTEDERWLWPEFSRIISELRPAIVFLENSDKITAPIKRNRIVVAPALALEVIASLTEMGFNAQWGIVPAQAAGAPHRRDRWWCFAWSVSNANSIRQRRESRRAEFGQNSPHSQREYEVQGCKRSAELHEAIASDSLPTPTAGDWRDPLPYPSAMNRKSPRLAPIVAMMYHTPTATHSRQGNRSTNNSGIPLLPAQIIQYRTPTARDHHPSSGRGRPGRKVQIQLAHQIAAYATPNERDWKGQPSKSWKNQKSLPRDLNSNNSTARMNPTWEESCLMGFPVGWSDRRVPNYGLHRLGCNPTLLSLRALLMTNMIGRIVFKRLVIRWLFLWYLRLQQVSKRHLTDFIPHKTNKRSNKKSVSQPKERSFCLYSMTTKESIA